MGRLGYRPALDGVRGIAITAVLLSHAGLVAGGYLGVDVFFVLSGFLITTLLLEEWEASSRIGLRSFYRRRAARLLPALAFLIGLLIVLVAIIVSAGKLGPGALDRLLEECLYVTLYVTNFAKIFVPHMKLGYLWSLAEEEQFYIVWPALLIVVLRRHLSLHRLALALAAAVVVLAANRVVVYGLGGSWEWLISSPQTRSDPLATGCLAAVLRKAGAFDRLEGVAGAAGLVALAGVISMIAVVGDSRSGFVFGLLPLALMAAVLIVAVVLQPSALIAKTLAFGPLTFIGRISYSLYLWHSIFIVGSRGTDLIFAIAVSIGVAWLSYRYVERPCRRLLAGRRGPLIHATAPV